jgi:hypothetical protein
MTKAELRADYISERDAYAAGRYLTNEYALHLDEMLAKYFNLPGGAELSEGNDLD